MIKNRNIANDAAIAISKVLGGGLVGVGRVMYVAPATSELYTYWQTRVPEADLFSDIALAYAQMVSGRNDVLLLSPDTHTVTAMLNITKNRCHFIGVDQRGGIGMGARSKVSMGVTTAATDIAAVQNTGVGNTFIGIKFTSSNTKDISLYAVAEGGEYTVYQNCEFYKDTDLDVTGAAEILNNGDSVQWLNCTIGSSANQLSGAVIRPCMLLTATLSGKKCRDNVMLDCILLRKGGNVANRFIYGANATDVERMFYIDRTLFFSNPLGAATPAVGVDFGAAQTEGAVVLGAGCTSVDVTVLGATGEGVYTLAPSSPTYATSGIAVNA